MKTTLAVLGIIAYNLVFAWTYHVVEKGVDPARFSFSQSYIYGYILITLLMSFLIFIPVCKFTWNKLIAPLWDAPEITMLESLHLYSLLLLVAFVLRQHNFFLFLLTLISKG